MNTTLSTKLVALMLALSVNTVIMGGVALMFSSRAHGVPSLTVAATPATPATPAAIDRTAA